MRPRRAVQRWTGLIGVVLTMGGCGIVHGGPHMSYQDAKQELARLVDSALVAGLESEQLDVEPLVGEDPCTDSLGRPLDEVNLTYEYEFPLDALGEDPERLITSASQVWREAGLTIRRDDAVPGSPTVFAADDRGFNLAASVNRPRRKASVGGSGPCVEPPPS